MNTRENIARFESERQALALMDHPAIARVLDTGSTPEGGPRSQIVVHVGAQRFALNIACTASALPSESAAPARRQPFADMRDVLNTYRYPSQNGDFTTHDLGAFTGLQRTFSPGSDTWYPDSAFQSNG